MDKLKMWGRKLAIPAVLISLPILSFADVNLPEGSGLSLSKIQQLIETIANWLVIMGVIIAVIFIIWGGLKYMYARGDQTKATEAKESIKNGIIGAVVVLGVGVILRTLAAVVTRTFFGAGQ